tara:strand:+ start:12158 stop:12493 length:336 start_codon:yes stop_codon:yes gene_type:complete
MKKGDLVKLNNKALSRGHIVGQEKRTLGAVRPMTVDEKVSWINSLTDSMRELRVFPPKNKLVRLCEEDTYIVLDIDQTLEFGSKSFCKGMIKILAPNGEVAYIKQEYVDKW